ncbi:2-C-methyl-D-erythritol 4-phosphate cytidylyltransferase [Thermosipho atlanticus]|uniref:2-C-methyl-D-erythritol 4-phosphate cytidylyltransferase n=1 Tax=Thermosipho atlanticus DSM 15807 TaxID=1123380 RepID=A0A1M5SHR8_9BACT|nr:2-C-methyl-D-erythritol 4-phosphate cytidylyltransferase [Thermosipho atlanticus]SHH38086.1 2-C-methyl-D-erythritol 4-phosphate cytidylyltransferase [Thermosipho atlanticus DSM 15807]
MVVAVLLFGGKGERFDKNTPKQFFNLSGKLIIEHTIEKFLIPDIDFIVVVTNSNYLEKTKDIVKKYTSKKEIYIIEGGKCREESTFKALKFLKNKMKKNDIVLVHDGARPFVTTEIIINNIKKAEYFGAAVTAIPSENTIGIVEENLLMDFPNRNSVYIIQTPQSFKFEIIFDSFLKKQPFLCTFTDDSSIVKKSGYKVYITNGNKLNVKITTKEDIKLAKFLIWSESIERDL